MHRLCRGRERALSKSRPNSRTFSCVLIADANEMIQMSYPLSISSWTRASEAAGINASRPLGPWRSWAIVRCQSRPSSGRSAAPGESAWRRRLSTGTASPSSEGKADFGFGANFTLAGVSCTVRDVKEPFADAAATFEVLGGGFEPDEADLAAVGVLEEGFVVETSTGSAVETFEDGFDAALFTCFGDFAFFGAAAFTSAGAKDSSTAEASATSIASAITAASLANASLLLGAGTDDGFEILLRNGDLDLLFADPSTAFGGSAGAAFGGVTGAGPAAAEELGIQTQLNCQAPSSSVEGTGGGAIGLATGTATKDVEVMVDSFGLDALAGNLLTSEVSRRGGVGSMAPDSTAFATAPAALADLERSSRRCCWRLSDSKFSGSKKSKCETRPRSCLCLWDLRLGSPPRFPRNFAFGGPLAIPRKARSKGKGCAADVKTSDAIQCLVPKAQ